MIVSISKLNFALSLASGKDCGEWTPSYSFVVVLDNYVSWNVSVQNHPKNARKQMNYMSSSKCISPSIEDFLPLDQKNPTIALKNTLFQDDIM